MTWPVVLAVLLRLQLWAPDGAGDPIARAERLRVASVAVAAASSDRDLVAALLALGEAETRFAAYVGEDRCHEGPRGARCDQGRARSYWQLHRKACRDLWALPSGDERTTHIAAQCAARLMRWGRNYCGNWAGAFAVYAGRRCKDPLGVPRAARMNQIRAMLDQK